MFLKTLNVLSGGYSLGHEPDNLTILLSKFQARGAHPDGGSFNHAVAPTVSRQLASTCPTFPLLVEAVTCYFENSAPDVS